MKAAQPNLVQPLMNPRGWSPSISMLRVSAPLLTAIAQELGEPGDDVDANATGTWYSALHGSRTARRITPRGSSSRHLFSRRCLL